MVGINIVYNYKSQDFTHAHWDLKSVVVFVFPVIKYSKYYGQLLGYQLVNY